MNTKAIAKFRKNVDERIKNASPLKVLWMMLDYGFESRSHGVLMDDYFKYRFFDLSRSGRKLFSSGKKRIDFAKHFNEQKDCSVFDEKDIFVKRFKDYLGRQILEMKTASLEEFSRFAEENPVFFAKPSGGRFGIGTKKYECSDTEAIQTAFHELTGKDYLVEGYIHQCNEFAEFNESSVNSLRVITLLRKNGDVFVFPYAALRLGRKGNVADNFHFDGIACLVETETGTVICPGQDQHGKRYSYHPDSHKQIVGYHIPKWESICELVKQAAKVCPTVRFVGWDVTLTADDHVVLIEGNTRPDPDIIQIQDGVGKWDIYEELMEDEA